MAEEQFIYQFIDFLVTQKGYPKGSILLEAPLADRRDGFRRYIADLILLDTEYDNYLALIEFKVKVRNAISESLLQVKSYLSILDKPNLPAYLVIPKSENNKVVDFVIY